MTTVSIVLVTGLCKETVADTYRVPSVWGMWNTNGYYYVITCPEYSDP